MAIIKQISVSYRCSYEHKRGWHTCEFGLVAEVEEDDDLPTLKKKLWDTCIVEVEKQIAQLSEPV